MIFVSPTLRARRFVARKFTRFRHQLPAPVNSLAAQASTSVGQAVALGNLTQLEEIGLSPRQVTLSLSAQF